jgi:HEAT repeat protein
MSKSRLWPGVIAVLLILVAAAAWFEPTRVVRGWLAGQAFFQGRPTAYWSRSLRTDDPQGRQKTLASLKAGGAEATPVLIELLGETAPPAEEAVEVRWTAADLLGQEGKAGAPAVGALTRAIRDPDPHVRSVAARALGQIGPEAREAVPGLIELLSGEERLDALKALAGLRAEALPAVEPVKTLLKDPSDRVRWQAARVLGKIGPAAAPASPSLIEALKDEDDEVREHAAEALGEIGPTAPNVDQTVTALAAVLKDPKSNVRRDAVRSLGQLGKAALPALSEVKKLVQDPAQPVRDAAARSVRLITGAESTKKDA